MTLSCAKIQHHKDFSQKQVESHLTIPEQAKWEKVKGIHCLLMYKLPYDFMGYRIPSSTNHWLIFSVTLTSTSQLISPIWKMSATNHALLKWWREEFMEKSECQNGRNSRKLGAWSSSGCTHLEDQPACANLVKHNTDHLMSCPTGVLLLHALQHDSKS